LCLVIKFGAAYFAAPCHFYGRHPGRIDGECPLYADAVRHLSYRKRFPGAAMLFFDDDAFKNLNSFPLSFNDLDMYLTGRRREYGRSF
jgi:hypothetical protein